MPVTPVRAPVAPAALAPLQRRLARAHADQPFVRDAAQVARWLPWVKRVTSYFTPHIGHAERVPDRGPVLVVANHSCSYYMPDAWIVAGTVADRRPSAPVYGLVYDLLLAIPGYGPFLRRSGALPADERWARRALDSGGAVLVFPGGDHDACRPWQDRDLVDFGGRCGFVRLALRTGVPIVPAVAYGAHHGMVVLARGEPIARLLRLALLRVKVMPLMLAPPFGVAPVLAPPPLPAQVSVEFLAPMTWPHLGPEAADDPAAVAACYEEVTGAMQQAMDALAAEHPHPVAEGVRSLASRCVTAVVRRLA